MKKEKLKDYENEIVEMAATEGKISAEEKWEIWVCLLNCCNFMFRLFQSCSYAVHIRANGAIMDSIMRGKI